MNTIFIFGAKYLLFVSIVIALYFFWKSDRKKEIFRFGIFSLPLTYIAGKILSKLYYDPRPFVVNDTTPLIPHAPDNGFPSDHTLLAAALASLVSIFNRKMGAILWAITIFIGISRVYVGVHHIVDILASIIISIIVASLVYYFGKNERVELE